MIGLIIGLHTLVSLVLIVLVLLHSGKGGGVGDLFGGSSSAIGGTTIIEKNLDRITIVSAVIFAVTTLILTKYFR